MARLNKRTGSIAPEILVRHVLQCVPPQEWPTRVEAADALLRRLDSSQRDKLRVESRPPGGKLLGPYATRRPGSGSRPYRTVLHGVNPLHGRCDCPDFVKNSLALCKHILVALEHICARPRLLQQARNEQEWSDLAAADGICWDPIRPLTGAGDWLERVTWRGDIDAIAARSSRAAAALKWFRLSKAGVSTLKNTHQDRPKRRLELIEDLLRVIPASAAAARHDPALRALLEREQRRLRSLVEQALSPSELREAFKRLKRPLHPYQREGVERFLEAGRLLLADDMGLGKTAQAIACCEIMRRAGRIRRGLIITPASLKPQWEREWGIFSDLPVQIVDGGQEDRQTAYARNKEGFLITNYEQVLRDLETIRRWAPDLVVLDEAQRIKNWATKTAFSIKGLAPPFRLVLTGTPMENRIDELASIVEWVDDMALEPKWRLGSMHAIRSDGRREVVGARHLGTIRERLRHCMIRRIRQEVLDQLPPRTDTRVPIQMTEAQIGEHDALNQPIAALVERSLKRPLTHAEFLKLMMLLTTQRIISNGLAQLQFEELWPTIQNRLPEENLLQGLSAPKLVELRQLARQVVLDQSRKVVVFSQWRRMLALAHWAISDLLAQHGLRAGFFTGAERQTRRTQNIVEFHDDPDFRMLFASDAGGVGLNLQRAANCVINIELPWNPAVLEQRIGRVYRLGQKDPIDVYNLVSEQGIESRIANLVGSKQAFFKGLFDGDSDTVDFGQASNFLARVQKLYEPVSAEAVAAARDDGEGADSAEDASLDDDVALPDPFDELIEAADEAQDTVATVDGDAERTGAAAQAAPRPGPQSTATPGSVAPDFPVPAGALPSHEEVRQLFSQLQVRRGESGKVVIEAPPEAASTLGALFEGMAALLHSVGRTRD
jgi:superfamily II DNA or RNA helicase